MYLNENLTASDSTKFRFATDGEGNYGYLKADDSFVPFKSGTRYGMIIPFIDTFKSTTNNKSSDIFFYQITLEESSIYSNLNGYPYSNLFAEGGINERYHVVGNGISAYLYIRFNCNFEIDKMDIFSRASNEEFELSVSSDNGLTYETIGTYIAEKDTVKTFTFDKIRGNVIRLYFTKKHMHRISNLNFYGNIYY